MGTADLIPGVSGGTVAFLSGIYEELLFSIKTINREFFQLLFKKQIRQALALIPFRFLTPLALGIFTALLTLAQVLIFLLHKYPTFVWAFFFGLVLASVRVVLKRIVKWNLSDKISFIVSAIITYFVVSLIPIHTPNTLPFFFVSGAIAISAMILPGVSGSFILLLLGKYQQILKAVTNRDLLILGVFMAGCVFGLALFARILSWLFRHHHDISVSILAGIMLGSVRKLWPWQEVVSTRINSHGEEIPFIVKNVLPQALDISTILALFFILLGAMLVFFLDRMHLTKEQVSDIENKSFKEAHKESLKNQ